MSYSNQQISYHWLTVGLIIVMVCSGLAYSYDLVDGGAMFAHQIAGQLLIGVLVLRIATRVLSRSPTPVESHAAWERHLAQLVHLALYLCLLAFVVTGYISASAEIDSVLLAPVSLTFARSDLGEWLLEIHYLMKWILLALFGLHFIGAMKHALIDKDSTLSRMTFTSRKEDPHA